MSLSGELLPGTEIAGRYVITSPLGSGGIGSVYRALHRGLRVEVALKTLHLQYSLNQEFRVRFEREARVMARLKHPGAVDVQDFGEHEGMLFLVMELLRGRNLREVLHKSSSSYERTHTRAEQLAAVLAEAHRIGLVHRDLKPENVIVEHPGEDRERLVVVDFGLAFLEGGGAELGRMTETGIVVGTPLYVSPEQAEGASVGGAADIYSLGCMLYEMVAGQPPFLGRSTLQILNGHLFVPPKPLGTLVGEEEVPTGFSQLVMSMLAKSPRERPSAAEVVERLRYVSPRSTLRPRGRGDLALQDRGERAVTMDGAGRRPPTPAPLAPTQPASASSRALAAEEAPSLLGASVGVVGLTGFPVTNEVIQQFAANGLAVALRPDGAPAEGDVIWVSLEASPEAARAAIQQGIPVVAATSPGDMERFSQLLRAGVAEVLTLPLDTADLVRKTLRALKKARRRDP